MENLENYINDNVIWPHMRLRQVRIHKKFQLQMIFKKKH